MATGGMKVLGQAFGKNWAAYHGDCAEVLEGIPAGSVGLSVSSPPFAQLYTYSASARDMGNTRDFADFLAQYRFAVEGLLKATMPGRRACVHVQQIAMTQVMHGIIKWYDFRADVRALYEACGWIYHGEVVIDKDPQAQAIRTKSKTLLFIQKDKDSSWSIPAMADYILTNEEWIRWARPIWYGIRESATLQASPARGENDDSDETVPIRAFVAHLRTSLPAGPLGDGMRDWLDLHTGRYLRQRGEEAVA